MDREMLKLNQDHKRGHKMEIAENKRYVDCSSMQEQVAQAYQSAFKCVRSKQLSEPKEGQRQTNKQTFVGVSSEHYLWGCICYLFDGSSPSASPQCSVPCYGGNLPADKL